MIWDMDSQGSEMRTLGLTKDAEMMLSSTENPQSAAAYEYHQQNYLRCA